jgi:hypothetical protein
MVDPQHDDNLCANLVFLEQSDVMECPEYSIPPDDPDQELHPVAWKEFTRFEVEYTGNSLLTSSEWLWTRHPYSLAASLSSTTDGGMPKWTKPDLQHKTVISLQRKLDFLQRKQEYDRDRDAERAGVTLTARNYNSLEVSVPLLTTFADPCFVKPGILRSR